MSNVRASIPFSTDNSFLTKFQQLQQLNERTELGGDGMSDVGAVVEQKNTTMVEMATAMLEH